jgi:hypothetical protein
MTQEKLTQSEIDKKIEKLSRAEKYSRLGASALLLGAIGAGLISNEHKEEANEATTVAQELEERNDPEADKWQKSAEDHEDLAAAWNMGMAAGGMASLVTTLELPSRFRAQRKMLTSQTSDHQEKK